jgi:hypothetical protein
MISERFIISSSSLLKIGTPTLIEVKNGRVDATWRYNLVSIWPGPPHSGV